MQLTEVHPLFLHEVPFATFPSTEMETNDSTSMRHSSILDSV